MTTGQQLIEQGRKQGIPQGIQQGIQRVLLRLLRQRFGDEVASQVEQCIAGASVEQIDTWTLRLLSAATVAEIFAA